MSLGVIDIQPSILVWARQSLGLTLEEAATKLRRPPEELANWEAGLSRPTYAQLEKLAERYKRPLLTFFLPKPPEEAPLSTDFRTMDSLVLEELDSSTRLALRRSKALQDSLPTIFGEDNPSQDLRQLRAEDYDTADELVASVRQVLDFTVEEQAQWKDAYSALSDLRSRIEQNGIFVFQLSLTSVRGFAMYEPNYPIIGLSSKDAPQGRLFTLLHELCHLLYHDSDLFLNPYTERLLGEHKETERICNQFAAHFLLPQGAFEKAITHLPKNGYIREGEIEQLARKFCVGRIVVVRRLHDLQYVNRSFYLEKQKLYASQYSNKFSESRKSAGGGPGHYRSKISQLGKTYLSGVFEQLESGNLPALEASQLIGVKIDNFEKLADKLAS